MDSSSNSAPVNPDIPSRREEEINVGIRTTDADGFVHAVRAAPNWNESWYVDFLDAVWSGRLATNRQSPEQGEGRDVDVPHLAERSGRGRVRHAQDHVDRADGRSSKLARWSSPGLAAIPFS